MKRITLKEARTKKQLTQEALEELSGVNQATISAIESGRVTQPTIQTVCALAEALNIDPRALNFGVHSEAAR